MHLRLVHVPANSPCLLPLLGSRFLLTLKWESDFDLGLHKKFHLSNANLTTLFALIHYSRDTIFWKFLSLYFTCNLMWYILCDSLPTKRQVMSSSRSTSLLCRSTMEFFYGFLGMFHVGFIHPICLYWMVSFPFD